MCGHDGHMATLLSAAEVLIKKRNQIPKNKTIRLLFQPAEEDPGGAKPMIEEGCLDGVDEIYGFHNVPHWPEGNIRTKEGVVMAATTKVKITVYGKGGHGALPHMHKDPISAACSIFMNLHTIQSRAVASKENFVFTICNLTTGHTHNVMPDDAFMQGSIRTFNQEVLELVEQKIIEISENTAKAFGCKAVIEFDRMYPEVVNHPEQAHAVVKLIKDWFGEENYSYEDLPRSGSEDFSFYLQKKPGCFFHVGTR